MPYARAEDGSRVELSTSADNWAPLQAFLAAHTSIQLPAGRFPLSQTLNIVNGGTTLTGRGVEGTTLSLSIPFAGPVIGIGGQGTWAGGYPPANGVTLRGLTASMEVDASPQCKCIYNAGGNDFLVERCRVVGSPYEGIVSSSFSKRITLRDFEARNCGNGGIYYGLTTAGINCTSIDQLVDGFRCVGCGQGVECGNTRQVFRNGIITDPTVGGFGINVGSSVAGVYDTTIEYCTVRGYSSAIVCGNGNGRLAKVIVRHVDVDGFISFAGGKTANVVPHPDEGPDTYGSEISYNRVRIAAATDSGAIGYVSGINFSDSLYGREPLNILHNEITIDEHVAGTTPIIYFGGNISAACQLYANNINGIDSSPSRGDVASFSNLGNTAIPGIPNLVYGGNRAFNRNGAERALTYRIEGA